MGPLLAAMGAREVRGEHLPYRCAERISDVFSGAYFVPSEPRRSEAAAATRLRQVGKEFSHSALESQFMLFLLIFTGYWIVFWQEFIALPLYISTYIDPNANTARILATDPIVVILFTMVIGFLTKEMHAFHAIVLGT